MTKRANPESPALRCSVCRRLRAELDNLQRYMRHAPDAEFGRENLEHVIAVLIRMMDTPNGISHVSERSGDNVK